MADFLHKSILKPEGSLVAGIATGALVYGIYQMNLGNLATVHATPSGDGNARAARKKAAIESVAAVAAISLLARDVNIFILGGAITVLLDWHARHAVEAHPETGQLADNSGYVPAEQSVPAADQAQVMGAEDVYAY
ncbi:MAG TPA: hypothetical protein VKU39_11250 [Streptosporangiaceae bacterium]|nr:hypothetical protein [Streptosporangiaceae bacterium]